MAVNPFITEQFAPNPVASVNPLQVYTFIAGWAWVIGMVLLVINAAVSYIKLRFRVREAVSIGNRTYICDRIESPFILGIIKPKIYLPSDISEQDIVFVTEHENAHLKRLDHIWKPIGFLLLILHWFNPLVWAAYILLCRDIELACDERVIGEKDVEYKKSYSNALISCSGKRRYVSACPLAFGETGIKARIKNVLSFKKPTIWVICAAILTITVLAVCFLTDPHSIKGIQNQVKGGDADIKVTSAELDGISPYIEIERKNHLDTDMQYGEEYYIYRKVNDKWIDCRITDNYVYHLTLSTLGSKHVRKQRFYLSDQDMAQTGRYKIEVFFNEEGKQEQSAWVEFDLTKPVEAVMLKDIVGKEIVYSDGSYSYVPTEANFKFRLQNGMNLLKVGEDTDYSYLGVLEEITLSKATFDNRIFWEKPKGMRENNKRAWQLLATVNGVERLYMLLEQKNGEFYFCEGYYGLNLTNPKTDDNSQIRFIYKVDMDVLFFKDETVLPTTDLFESFEYTDKDGCVRSLKLFHDGTFSLNEHIYSSYFNHGTYYFAENKLFLHTFAKDRVIVFDIIDYSTIKFNLTDSMGITANTLPDGAEFKLTSLSPTTSGSGIF